MYLAGKPKGAEKLMLSGNKGDEVKKEENGGLVHKILPKIRSLFSILLPFTLFQTDHSGIAQNAAMCKTPRQQYMTHPKFVSTKDGDLLHNMYILIF